MTKLSSIRLRFWWQGYNPREAFNVGNFDTDFEVSKDGGFQWDMGKFNQAMRDVWFWMQEEGIEVDAVKLVDQRNGKTGWRGEYVVSFKKKAWREPEEPLWVQEELPNPTLQWVKGALQIPQPVSDPDGETKPHSLVDPGYRSVDWSKSKTI